MKYTVVSTDRDGVTVSDDATYQRHRKIDWQTLVDASRQAGAELAGNYRGILAQAAGDVRVDVTISRDGHRDNNVSWLTLSIVHGETSVAQVCESCETSHARHATDDADMHRLMRRAIWLGLGGAKFSRIDLTTCRAVCRTLSEAMTVLDRIHSPAHREPAIIV